MPVAQCAGEQEALDFGSAEAAESMIAIGIHMLFAAVVGAAGD